MHKNYKNKSVLITGGTGLIGSNLTEKLMDYGDVKVTVIARNENKIKDVFAKYLNNPNFKYIIQDVSTPFDFKEEFDYVFHAAGAISGETIRNYPVDIINANIEGTKNCLEYLKRKSKGRLVIFSSATVYGNSTDKNITVNENETTITDKLGSPICAYSQSKRMAETLANAYFAQFHTDVVIARFSYVYGFTKYYPNTAFFDFIKKALNGEDIILNGTCFAKRDNIFVDDAVNMLLLIASKGLSGEAYNVSSSGIGKNFAGIDEIAEYITNAANKLKNTHVKVIKKHFDEINRDAGIILDNAKTLALSGFTGGGYYYSIDKGIYQTVKQFNQYVIAQGGGAK